ncbi:hypothetical protein [uncultured Draconibacterium sp.]
MASSVKVPLFLKQGEVITK